MALTYSTEQTITITPTSLGNGLAQESAALDNSTNLYLDADLYIQVATGTGSSSTGTVNVYLACSYNGTTWPDTITGNNGGVILTVPNNLIFIGCINTPVASTIYDKTFPGIGALMGGKLTKKWSIVLENKTGAALSSTAGNTVVKFTGITY